LINSVVDELEREIKAPRALIFSAVLATVSLVLQGRIDVRKPKGGISPCSLMLLCIADSGERKTAIDKIVLGTIKALQGKMDSEYKTTHTKWQASLKLWEINQKSIQRNIEKLAKSGQPTDEQEERYLQGYELKPERPRRFKILYEDVTSEALLYGLYQDISTAGIITSEGGGVLNGPALNDLSKQNSLWSGDTVHVNRITRESFTIEDARLTVSMMVQESMFKKYMKTNGEQSRGSGLLARFLVCRPESTRGRRFIDAGKASSEHTERFNSRVASLLDENISNLKLGARERQVLMFSDEAESRWIDVFNFIEKEMAAGGFWADTKDHASKLADNIARLAALFHCFENVGDGDAISLLALELAISVGFWYSAEFVKIFDKNGQLETDANELLRWLDRKVLDGDTYIRKNYVLQHGPSRLRKKSCLEDVLDYLKCKGGVSIEYFDSVCYINTRPSPVRRLLGFTDPIDLGF
jgi:hypothetical protein